MGPWVQLACPGLRPGAVPEATVDGEPLGQLLYHGQVLLEKLFAAWPWVEVMGVLY